MRQLEGLCLLRHGEIMCVFLSAPLPAILLGLSDIYSKSRDSKVGLFLFPRRGLSNLFPGRGFVVQLSCSSGPQVRLQSTVVNYSCRSRTGHVLVRRW